MTRRTLPIALALLIAATSAAAGQAGSQMSVRQMTALQSLGADVHVVLDRHQVPEWITGHLSVRTSDDPVFAAAQGLERHGAAFRKGADDSFAHRLNEVDHRGETHVRMGQLYKGLPVVGAELVVHLDSSAIIGVNGRFVADLDLDTFVPATPERFAAGAEEWTVAGGGHAVTVMEVGEPVVYAGDLESEPRTAVRVLLAYLDEEGLQVDDVYVDAQTGQALGKTPRVFRAKNRAVYNLNQGCISSGSNLPGTLVISEGGSSADSAVMGAYNGTGTTYDFYKNVFGRDSYDGAGAQLKSTVHAQFSTGTSCTKNNAAWLDSPYNQMAFGDGDGSTFLNLATSLDVTAHELTHAVTSRSANLVYQKESGALNEAVSDILGEATAFYVGQGDWKIGAEIYTPGTSGDALRYFANPTADGYSADYYPERLYSGTCTPSSSNDQCGVHGNSGIANLQAYLLSQGGSHPRSKTTTVVTGIGITKTQAIWYRALTVYMTSSTTFQGARTALASAASDLYGGTCTPEWTAVHKAWDAVGVPGTWSCGGTTYSISGNAGTTGATVTAGTATATSDASSNFTLSGLAAGTYTVTPTKSGCTFSPTSRSVTITSANVTGVTFTASCTSGDTQLTSGVALSGQSVAAGAWKYYYISVPSGASSLVFATTGATGDVDIYTQFNAKPTSSSYACRPYTSSGNETCTQSAPSAGTWWVGVYGYAAGSYTITATVTTSTPTYSISGSAGTASATVAAGTKSATSDASGNYTITGLAAGTYTVTPSKSGCTFSPASQSVTITSANVTGKNFTATCGGGGTPTERLANGGFETITASTNTAPDGSWARSAYTGTSFNTMVANGSAPYAGTDYGYLGVYTSSSQTLDAKAVTIPAAATSATLSFYVSIVTSETTTATAYDKLQVQLVDASTGSVLSTLATLSNLNKTASSTTYALKSYSVLSQKGKNVKVRFYATNDSSLVTTFRIDNVSLKSDG